MVFAESDPLYQRVKINGFEEVRYVNAREQVLDALLPGPLRDFLRPHCGFRRNRPPIPE
jgi:hypothetical protein